MERILVTGVSGFVGNHLVAELKKYGYEVVGVGGPRLTGTHKPNTDAITTYYEIDLVDKAQVDTIDFTNVTGVIHLAGLAAVGPSFDNPVEYIHKNAAMEINLIEAALKQKCKPRFVVVSSGALYDPTAELPITETSSVVPSSPYAVSKIAQEKMGQYYGLRGLEVIIARPFNHIGPGQNIGFIAPDLTKQIIDIEHGKATGIMVGNLDAKRDYTDVRDIARGYRLLLESGIPGEIYNICTGTSLSGNELLKMLLKHTEITPTITQDSSRMRPSDTPDIYGSHDKLTRDTGWQPEISLDQTLEDVVADWRSRKK